jgi:hypothetical protein
MAHTPKRPRDPNQLAKLMVDLASGEVTDGPQIASRDAGKDPAAVELGRKGGLKGGAARAAKLTSEERSAISKKAALTRWKR